MLSVAQAVTLACLWEVTAAKPGNVHRGADFDDVTFSDFATSAVLIGPLLASAATDGVGLAILKAVQATRDAIGTNTNLGMILLLGPLAAVPPEEDLRSGVARVLRRLTPEDAAAVYQAIALAQPGGLGKVDEADVAGEPPQSLVEAMRLAAARDFVAKQYADDYCDVFEHVVAPLVSACQSGLSLTSAIIDTYVRLIAKFGDSLIARKCGAETSQQASIFAQQVLAAGSPGEENYFEALADFDFWLRCDGHRRNPGTSADLIAAGLYVVFREQLIPPPWK
jgi:triphosphoribosyl-dephospho-CoA synthase